MCTENRKWKTNNAEMKKAFIEGYNTTNCSIHFARFMVAPYTQHVLDPLTIVALINYSS